MRAIHITSPGGPEVLKMIDCPDPTPKEYEILVEVKATALNRADTLQRRGLYPPPPGASEIPGLEMSGTVIRLGTKVSKWKIGDRVCGLLAGGGYASKVVIHENLALSIPQAFSYEEAAAIPEVFLTAFQALQFLAKVKANDTVLIHAGASGVGTAAIQLAKTWGSTIFATASAGKHDICKSLGADQVIDYKTQSFVEEIPPLINRQTKEQTTKGVDVILDFIGAPYFNDNLKLLNPDGRLIILAFMGGTSVDEVSLAQILRKRLKIIGTTLRARSLDYKIHLTNEFKNTCWSDFENGKLKPVIDSIYDWTQVAEAHRYMEANQNKGKVILRVHS